MPKGTQTTEIVQLPQGTFASKPGAPDYELAKFMASDEKPPRSFTFNSDEFAPWSDELTPATRGTLATIVLILRNYPEARISIAGYTDDVGDAAKNISLSQHRVDALMQLLVQAGISRDRIIAVGKGTGNPIADNRTEQGRARNRRVELTVVAKG